MSISLKDLAVGLPARAPIKIGASTTELVQAFANMQEGDELHLTPGYTYLAVGANDFNTTKGFTLYGNAAKIKPADPNAYWAGSRALVQASNKIHTSGVLGTTFAATKGSPNVTFSAAVTYVPVVGDVLVLRGSATRLAAGNYTHGFIAEIRAVAGLNVTLDLPAYASFTVDSIDVYRMGAVKIYGLTLDMSEVIVGTSYFSAGIQILGGKKHAIENCKFIGNESAQIGANVLYSTGFTANGNEFSSFWNFAGIVGGRLGYGINSGSNNTSIKDNTFWHCKHAVTAGPRDVTVSNYVVTENVIYEDPSKLAESVGGSIDSHAGVIDEPVYSNNKIYCLKQAFNARGGKARIYGNEVYRISSSTLGMVRQETEQPFTGLYVYDNTFDCANGGPVFDRSWNIGDTVSNVQIYKNKIIRGTVVNIGSVTGSLKDFNFSENEIDSTGAAGTVFSISLAAGATVAGLKIEKNIVNNPSAQSVVSVIAGLTADYKNVTVDDLSIDGNKFSNTAGSSISAISLTGILGSKINVKNNRSTHTTPTSVFRIASCSLTQVDISGNTLTGGQILFSNAAVTGVADTYTDVSVTLNNIIYNGGGHFGVTETGDDIVFLSSRFSFNTLYATASVRAFVWLNKAGSTAWAASSQFDVTGNKITTTSGVGCIQVGVNGTGHKLLFNHNQLSSPIEDLSSTYYGMPVGNTYVLGTQTWRGGTTVLKSDGRLTAAAAPTTGAWTVNETVVWNSAPTTGQPMGWVPSVAGTPGTWKAMASFA